MENNIPFDDRDLKKDLWAKIEERARNRKQYITDELAKAKGHIVLHSPVAHCELNPIEVVWSNVKRYLKDHNQTYKLADLEKLVPDAFQSVTQETWANHCQHVEKEEERFWDLDGLQEDLVEQFIIELGVDEEEDDELEVEDMTGAAEEEGDEATEEDDEEVPEMDANDRILSETDALVEGDGADV